MTHKFQLIAEIGINHNSSLEMAKELIRISAAAGFDFCKFQKRTPELCVPDHMKQKMRKTPWGTEETYMSYREKMEFSLEQYQEIDKTCQELGIGWFFSAWDKPSVDFVKNFENVKYLKIPSALITNLDLVAHARKVCEETNRMLMISTGMTTEEDIEKAVQIGNPQVIFHTNSTYPCQPENLNLNYILHLKNKYPDKIISYSGHEFGISMSVAAAALMGNGFIERHVSKNRELPGSDQAASVEPVGMFKLVKAIRDVERALGEPVGTPRIIYPSEMEKLKSLRG